MSTPQPQPAKPALLIAASLAIAGAGAAVFMVTAAPSESSVEMQAPAVAVSPDPRLAPARPPASMPDDPPRGLDQPSPTPSPTTTSKPNRLARDLQREQIWTALNRAHNLKPAAPGSAAPSSSAASLLPTLDRNYVREAIRKQLVPVAEDCYNTVLTKHDAKAGGELIMKFTIIGVDEVGGVVEEAAIDEASTFDNEFMRECMRESVMTVTFPPPPDGGRVEVRYPFTFSAD
jgi:hypothetical protein